MRGPNAVQCSRELREGRAQFYFARFPAGGLQALCSNRDSAKFLQNVRGYNNTPQGAKS